MAGIYHNYNLSAQIPYRVQFVCEKCGKKNSLTHSVKSESAYTDRGALRKKTMAGRKEKAVGQLNRNTANLIAKIADETGRKKYRRIHLTCKCSNCSHLPVWAYPGWFNIAKTIASVSFFVAFLIFLSMCPECFRGEGNWRPFVIAVTPGVLCCLGTLVYSGWQTRQIERLDEQYLPTIVLAGKK